MSLFDFFFGKQKPRTNIEHDIITDDNNSGLFPENEEDPDEICEFCGEFLEDCECDHKKQSREDAGLSYEDIDELEDMEENDFDDDDLDDW